MKRLILAFPVFIFLASPSVRATTVTPVYSFTTASGYQPYAPLLQASDGNFYGTTTAGGDDGSGCVHTCGGTVFKLTPQGQLTVLHTFAYGDAAAPWLDGQTPRGGLVEGPDGYLYGTTYSGGAVHNIYGTIYKISKAGSFQKIHDFCPLTPCPDGANPEGSLVLGSDGNFYGTTTVPIIAPRIFRISASGNYSVVASFLNAGLGTPQNGLIQASDGNYYGISTVAVYRVTSGGVLNGIYTFGTQAGDGTSGNGPLVQGSDGNLYGVTFQGGAHSAGTVFKISLNGVYQKIYDLLATTDGFYANAVMLASDGKLWGTSSNATGSLSGGAVYSIDTAGSFQQSSIMTNTTGKAAKARLIQASDGRLYGTTTQMGANSGGTVFVVDAGLGPPAPGEGGASAAPMRVTSYDKATGDITVSCGGACSATDHHIVYGALADLPTYAYGGQVCGLGNTGAATFNPGARSAFWVLVGNTLLLEGSYGRGAGGAERPQAIGLAGCSFSRILTSICP